MTVYRAINEETGEVIEGGASDLARKLGVTRNCIYNASSKGYVVRDSWTVKCRNQQLDEETKADRLSPQNLEDWDRFTAPYKALSEKKRKKKNRSRLRTRYNVGVY